MPVILNEWDMKAAIDSISNVNILTYDLETTGLNPYHGDEILGVAFGSRASDYYYLPLRHTLGANAPMELLSQLKYFLCNAGLTLVGHNIKFDLHFTKAAGLPIEPKVIDTMLMGHIYNEHDRPFSLEELGLKRLGISKTKHQDELIALAQIHIPKLISRVRTRQSILNVVMGNLKYLPMETVAEYAINDLIVTEKLYEWYDGKLCTEPYYPLVSQLGEYTKCLREMEENGLLIDMETTKEKSVDAAQCMEEVIDEIEQITAVRINPNSWKQVKELLLDYSTEYQQLPYHLQLTDEGTLSKLDDPLAKLVTEYHKWSKVKGTYYDMFLEMVDKNNMLHYSSKIHGTVTTRLSIPKPALQTIPRQNEKNYMYKVKDCVVTHPGYKLVEVDYSQLELRLAAHFSLDATMVTAYNEGKDLHTVTAERLGISRQDAKPVNFGFLYGSGAESFKIFAEEKYGLKMSLDQAKKYRKQFFDSYPGLVIYTKSITQFAEKNKYIKLITGRKLRFANTNEYYTGLNKQIQGSGAELLRISMTKMYRKFNGITDYEPPKLLIAVHDSLLFEIKEDLVDYWMPTIKYIMTYFKLNVPLAIDAKVGSRWGDMISYKFLEE